MRKYAQHNKVEASGYPSPGETAVWAPYFGSQLSRHASVHLKHSINGKLRTQLTLTPPGSTVEPTQLVKFNFLQSHRDLTQMPPPLKSS